VNAERSCEVCGATSHEPLYDVDGYLIVRCRTCKLVFVGTVVGAADLIKLYGEAYWEDPEATGYAGYLSAEPRKRHHFRGLVRALNALSAPGALLEIGSAYGYFLDEARSSGWQVRGVEPSEHAARHAREQFGLEIVPGPFSDLPTEEASLDAIALWDVIEHLPDPRRTLASAYEWLRPGAILAISTGDVASLSARLHGAHWSLMTPPWHQFYFSRHTLGRLLQEIGFSIVRSGGDGVVAVDAGSSSPRIRGVLSAVLQHRLVTTAARRLGRGMTMFVFARKGSG
jgi:SAM-dependent methyltransferase